MPTFFFLSWQDEQNKVVGDLSDVSDNEVLEFIPLAYFDRETNS